jgi:hypothetical protein
MHDRQLDTLRDPLTRVLLVVLLVGDLFVGVWAAVAPQSFYDSFPGGGRVWVAVDGPYNEHLVRDVGTLYLAIGMLTIAALIRPIRYFVVMIAGAHLVAGVPHFVYHMAHLDLLGSSDKVGEAFSLGLGVVAAAILLVRALKVSVRFDDDQKHAAAVAAVNRTA